MKKKALKNFEEKSINLNLVFGGKDDKKDKLEEDVYSSWGFLEIERG